MAIIAAIGGPFGWYDNVPLGLRFVFWISVIGVGVGAAALTRAALHDRLGWPRSWRTVVLVALVSALCVTPLVKLLARWLLGLGHSYLPHLGTTFVVAFLIALVSGGIRQMVGAPAAGPGETAALSDEGPRLLRRIDPEARGDLIRLSVRDHYVDVVTSAGQASLLLRLSDAITETEGVEGLHVHRSHWVAFEAIEAVERTAGRLVLRMRDGSRVPVSRNHRATLEQRGLI